MIAFTLLSAALLALADPDWLAQCVLTHTHAQLGEELVVLPTLVHATKGRPGTFVEYVSHSLKHQIAPHCLALSEI